MEVDVKETVFQRDVARSHTANAVLHFLSEHFYVRAISDDLELDSPGHRTRRI
jgi:hypothetical protein